MDGEDVPESQEPLKKAIQASLIAAKELTKDAVTLSRQSAALKAKAAETRLESQEARAQARLVGSSLPSAVLLTIPEAAARLRVAERTLRHVLSEADFQTRLVERTRKVGIYYKFIPLVPPDLMAALVSHFAGNKVSQNQNIQNQNKEAKKPGKGRTALLKEHLNAGQAGGE